MEFPRIRCATSGDRLLTKLVPASFFTSVEREQCLPEGSVLTLSIHGDREATQPAQVIANPFDSSCTSCSVNTDAGSGDATWTVPLAGNAKIERFRVRWEDDAGGRKADRLLLISGALVGVAASEFIVLLRRARLWPKDDPPRPPPPPSWKPPRQTRAPQPPEPH